MFIYNLNSWNSLFHNSLSVSFVHIQGNSKTIGNSFNQEVKIWDIHGCKLFRALWIWSKMYPYIIYIYLFVITPSLTVLIRALSSLFWFSNWKSACSTYLDSLKQWHREWRDNIQSRAYSGPNLTLFLIFIMCQKNKTLVFLLLDF